MGVRIVCAGKHQDKWLKDCLAIYDKKISRYTDFSWVFVKEVTAKTGNRDVWVAEEGKKILEKSDAQNIRVVCDEKGKQLTSVQFAKQFEKWLEAGKKHVDFIIGGPFGLDDAVKREADYKLGLSSMTMTHQMVRALLSEQIYRAYTILNNQKYHH